MQSPNRLTRRSLIKWLRSTSKRVNPWRTKTDIEPTTTLNPNRMNTMNNEKKSYNTLIIFRKVHLFIYYLLVKEKRQHDLQYLQKAKQLAKHHHNLYQDYLQNNQLSDL